MPNIAIAPGQIGTFTFKGVADDASVQPLTGVTATIDNYTAAYLATTPTPNQFLVVPRTTPPAGQTVTVTVTVSADDANSKPLPNLLQAWDIQGPPAPPVATSIVAVDGTSQTAPSPLPADGGNATISIVGA